VFDTDSRQVGCWCISVWLINLSFILSLSDNTFTNVISFVCRGVNEVFAFLGCYAMFIGS
jgi:hypothetical protein